MLRPIGFLALLGASLASAPAYAADWSSFESMFPAFPCADGWTACLVNGREVTPEPKRGDGSFLVAANQRLDWDSLEPTSSFSPFSGLSAYTGKAPEPEPEPEVETPPPADPPAVADVEPEHVAPPSYDNGGGSEPVHTPSTPKGGGTNSNSGGDAVADAQPVQPKGGGTEAGGDSMVKPRSSVLQGTSLDSQPAAVTAPTEPVKPEAEPPAKGGGTAVADVGGVKPPQGGGASDSCDNLTLLEPAAMMGKLSDGQVACLEASIGATAVQTDKDKVSRVLMANAWAKGDKKTWENLVKRHLDEIDQSDPDICYKYALYLSKKGVGRANGVIRWSDVALENKTRWSGEEYKSRVYSLYKLRAAAAQDLWKAAEEKHAGAPTDQTKAEVEKSRNTTKTYAREWFEYAKEAQKDTTVPLQLCISAAGTKEFCEGS